MARSISRLAIEDVSVEFGGIRALTDVSFALESGSIVGLIGPNGAGKSSLLSALAGLLPPSLGRATLDGRALASWSPPALARRRAMLSQQVQLGFAFRVEEVVMLGRSPHGGGREHASDQQAVEAAMHAAQVWHLRQRSYLQLSGGERQRVQLARVLAQVWQSHADAAPAWLLLDEPEAGLDVAHQHFVLQRARQLARQGLGVIAVLHELNLAARYADDIALLAQGRLLRHGSPTHALDPATLSTVYGLPLRRVALDDGSWMLAPA